MISSKVIMVFGDNWIDILILIFIINASMDFIDLRTHIKIIASPC
jgi:hypothetical protein